MQCAPTVFDATHSPDPPAPPAGCRGHEALPVLPCLAPFTPVPRCASPSASDKPDFALKYALLEDMMDIVDLENKNEGNLRIRVGAWENRQ